MVTVGEGLDKAVQGAFTRPVAKSAGAQIATWSDGTSAAPGAWPSCSASASAPSSGT